jgi:hypothetical protein
MPLVPEAGKKEDRSPERQHHHQQGHMTAVPVSGISFFREGQDRPLHDPEYFVHQYPPICAVDVLGLKAYHLI